MSYNENILIVEWLKTIVGGKIKPDLFYALFYMDKRFLIESRNRTKVNNILESWTELKKSETLVKVKNYLIWNSLELDWIT